jgi:glycosyltransferase involved in cell wall biosynthesis
MQKPIIASNIGWASEIIDDGVNGFLVHPKNHEEYANKIVTLVDNLDLQTQFGIEARKKIEAQFSIEVVARKSVEFYTTSIQKAIEKK